MESEKFLDCYGFAKAFGYFLYLKDGAFKDLRKRLQSFESLHGIQLEKEYKKVLILVPNDCYCDISKFPELNRKNNMIAVAKDVAGVQDRPYMLTVYESKLREEFETETTDPKYKYYIIDMAQCLDSLHRIRINKKALNNTQKEKVTRQFIDVLGYLLSNNKFHGYYEILTFSDGEKFGQVLKNKVRITNRNPIKIDLNYLGEGLACWYYYNYLLLTESDLLEAMTKWELKEKQKLADRRVYILIPNSCNCPGDIIHMNDTDCLEYAQDFNSNKSQITVGASYARVYKKSVLIVKSEGIKQMYCVAEYATPIRQLYRMFTSKFNEMKELSSSNITIKQMDDQRHKFVLQLTKLLQERNLYKIIKYPDHGNGFKVSDLLLRKVKESEGGKSTKDLAICQKVKQLNVAPIVCNGL